MQQCENHDQKRPLENNRQLLCAEFSTRSIERRLSDQLSLFPLCVALVRCSSPLHWAVCATASTHLALYSV